MDLAKTIILNRMVMALIKSKYTGSEMVGFTAPDRRYYQQLDRENELAIRILGRKAPTALKVDIYTTRVRNIVAELENNGDHRH